MILASNVYKSLKICNSRIYDKTGFLPSSINKGIIRAWKNYYVKNYFILRSIPRSGSHYFMNILAYYISINFFDKKLILDLKVIKDMFWDGWNPYHGYFDERLLYKHTGFKNFTFVHISHDTKIKRFNIYKKKFGGMVQLYRNPLDTVLSSYNRHVASLKLKSFSDKINEKDKNNFINELVKSYIHQYNLLKKINRKNNNVLDISYEQLKINPKDTIFEVLNFFNIAISEENIERAIKNSEIFKIKEKEKENNYKSFYNPLVSSHIHSGNIGQWRNFFTNDDVKNIERKLNESNIFLREFILE